ncbi:uncharacterized protein CIMG_11344 [Coccidioides immitis RS]|uniref:Uncharacterized protein n=1 Tax=Coccidioides immitis (strain RS) TaxID=246410 RepID=A0A0D8JUM5_COCIM|nr:uncharacterized protein CIMG_11344 [Coccidioides immitis RS]KJF60997.1 hypothetical protein CIMG_11344 [Coccidioides immitis RS]
MTLAGQTSVSTSKRLRLRRASPREDWGLGFVSPGLPITSLIRAEAALLGINQRLSLVLFPEIEFKRLGRLAPFPFEGTARPDFDWLALCMKVSWPKPEGGLFAVGIFICIFAPHRKGQNTPASKIHAGFCDEQRGPRPDSTLEKQISTRCIVNYPISNGRTL